MAYFKYLGKNIYYDVRPGWTTNHLKWDYDVNKSWESFKDEFSKHFQFIRVDFLDQGQSDAYEAPYTQDIQVEL